MNKEGFLILLEFCTVYFAFQYVAVFDPAAGFQARRLLVFSKAIILTKDIHINTANLYAVNFI